MYMNSQVEQFDLVFKMGEVSTAHRPQCPPSYQRISRRHKSF